jgi:hypothetical protein
VKISNLKARTMMRKVGDTEAPRMNTTSKAMAKAKATAAKSGWAGEEGEISVGGGDAKPMLSKPMRKRGGKC